MAATLCQRYTHEKYQPKRGKAALPEISVDVFYEIYEYITDFVYGRSPRVQGAYERTTVAAKL